MSGSRGSPFEQGDTGDPVCAADAGEDPVLPLHGLLDAVCLRAEFFCEGCERAGASLQGLTDTLPEFQVAHELIETRGVYRLHVDAIGLRCGIESVGGLTRRRCRAVFRWQGRTASWREYQSGAVKSAAPPVQRTGRTDTGRPLSTLPNEEAASRIDGTTSGT
jgi:hypothetical protein